MKKIDDHVGLHPPLEAFAKLLEQQRLAIVQSVGYPNPNRSHFESMAIWQTARLDHDKAAPGWLARAIDRRPGHAGRCAGAAHPRRDAAAAVARGGPAGDPVAGPARAVPPPPGRARRSEPQPRRSGPRSSWPARITVRPARSSSSSSAAL